jgi:hypothetical protein
VAASLLILSVKHQISAEEGGGADIENH